MEGGRSWIYDLPVERTVESSISYFGDAPGKPTFHAKDHRRDNWRPDIRTVTFHDARGWAEPPSLRREGVTIAPHSTRGAGLRRSRRGAPHLYPRARGAYPRADRCREGGRVSLRQHALLAAPPGLHGRCQQPARAFPARRRDAADLARAGRHLLRAEGGAGAGTGARRLQHLARPVRPAAGHAARRVRRADGRASRPRRGGRRLRRGRSALDHGRGLPGAPQPGAPLDLFQRHAAR